MKTIAAVAGAVLLFVVFIVGSKIPYEPDDVLAITAVKNELQRRWPEFGDHPVDFKLADVVEGAPAAMVVGSGVLIVEVADGEAVDEERTDFSYGGSVTVQCRSWDISCYQVSGVWLLADRSIAPKM